jgi:hypothetical protein
MGAVDLLAYQKIKGDVESVEDANEHEDAHADADRTSTIENAVLTVVGTLLAITLWMLVRSQGESPCSRNAGMPFDYGMDY